MDYMEEMGIKAKRASKLLAASGSLKDRALLCAADEIEKSADGILAANKGDMEFAKKAGMKDSLLDRLQLTGSRISSAADGMRKVAAQSDPIGTVISGGMRPNGLKIEKIRVPLGVVGIIYEARPNVTADAAALCLKASNAVILRGGKEAIRSNTAICLAMRKALKKSGLPEDCVQLVTDTSRESAGKMMKLRG